MSARVASSERPGEEDLREAGWLEVLSLADPGGDDDRDGLRLKPASGERERLRGFGVQPVRVIDGDEERGVLGRGGEERQCRRSHGQPVGRVPGFERERGPQRRRLPGGKIADLREERTAHLEQPSKGHLGFGRHAPGAHDEHVRGSPHGVLDQRGLPDARLAAQNEGAACPGACIVQKPVDRGALDLASDEHGETVSPHPPKRYPVAGRQVRGFPGSDAGDGDDTIAAS